MKSHGDYQPPQVAQAAGPGALSAGVAEDQYRNLFGQPRPSETFKGYQRNGVRDVERTGLMLVRLSKRMAVPFVWPGPASPGLPPHDNPAIPAGYTYLAQLAAHDLTQVSSAFPVLSGASPANVNLRSSKLLVETIYGGGPVETPSAYAQTRPGETTRSRFRLGLVRNSALRRDDLPERDIPRASCPHLRDGSQFGQPEVLIADPRNDSNLNLSQLVTLFHLLHNGLLGAMPLKEGNSTAADIFKREADHFRKTQSVVTFLYRRILVEDLLRRLLDPEIYQAYRNGGSQQRLIVDPFSSDDRIPVEFSHAAYRIGHAMVRPDYKLNDNAEHSGLLDIVANTSGHRPSQMPLLHSWVVQWSRFFEIGGSLPNLSRRLQPSFAAVLSDHRLFASFDSSGTAGLAYRDLVRHASVTLRSVNSIIDNLKQSDMTKAAVGRSPFLADAAERARLIKQWLLYHRGDLTDDDIFFLSSDPPLELFVLLEAALLQNGLRLGPVGSAIVGEVFFSALKHSEASIGGGAMTPDAVEQLATTACPEGLPNDMAALVQLVAARCHLTASPCAFV